MNLSPAAQHRLQAMGIDLWQRRPAQMPQASKQLSRIRLAAGNGEWLFVVQGGVADTERRLMDDIMATIGAPRCRFGEWSDSVDAGVSSDEWQARGIEHVLAFAEADSNRRPSRARLDDPRLIQLPSLSTLATSGDARKALWQQLSSRLGA
ncbi:MAG: hypothetical protein AAGH65_04330 [Pseudomonadota bacterium]